MIIFELDNNSTKLIFTDNADELSVDFGLLKLEHKDNPFHDQMILSYSSMLSLYLWLMEPVNSLYLKCNCDNEVLEISIYENGKNSTMDFYVRGSMDAKLYDSFFELSMLDVIKFKKALYTFLKNKKLI